MVKYKVCRTSDVPENGNRGFQIEGATLLIARVDGEFHAIQDICSHSGQSMTGGLMEGYQIKCPHHGACFDVRTGEALSLPAIAPVESYPVVIEGDEVFVELDDSFSV